MLKLGATEISCGSFLRHERVVEEEEVVCVSVGSVLTFDFKI